MDVVRDTPAGAITPPLRLHAPERRFGFIWRGDTGDPRDCREMLGWALAPEFAFEAIWQCDDGLPSGSEQTCYLQGPDARVTQLHHLGGWNPSREQQRS